MKKTILKIFGFLIIFLLTLENPSLAYQSLPMTSAALTTNFTLSQFLETKLNALIIALQQKIAEINNNLLPKASSRSLTQASDINNASAKNDVSKREVLPETKTLPTSQNSNENLLGANFYVNAESGNDTNYGTESSPWKTLSKMSSSSFLSGTTIHLHCSSVWREILSLPSNFAPTGDVTITKYGSCNQGDYPTINGADRVTTNWTRDLSLPGIAYATNITFEPTQLFFNGEKLIKARYPNYVGVGNEYNFLKLAPSLSVLTVSDTDRVIFTSRDIMGAHIYTRTEPWYIDKRYVSSYNIFTGEITLDQALAYPAETNGGYVLEGKKWMLDQAGEWYFDDVADMLYLWLPAGEDPNLHTIEGSVRNNSLVLNPNTNGITFDSIEFKFAAMEGIALFHSDNITFNSIVAKDAKYRNVYSYETSNLTFDNSLFSGASTISVDLWGGNNNRFINSEIKDLAINGEPDGSIAALSIASDNALVENNVFQNLAYVGVNFLNRNGTKISKNTIYNFCIRMSDCAAIYTFNGNRVSFPTTNTVVEKNTIYNASVNSNGTTESVVGGVYLDNFTSRVTVQDNTVSNVSTGIILNEPSDSIISGNTVWKAESAGLRAASRFSNELLRNQITGNTFFAARYYSSQANLPPKEEIDYAYYVQHLTKSLSEILTDPDANIISNNKIVSFSPLNAPLIFNWLNTTYTIDDWNNFGANDIQNTPITARTRYIITTGPSLIVDGDMPVPNVSWANYSAIPGQGSLNFNAGPLCTGTCAELISGSQNDLLISNSFNLSTDPQTNEYVLRYTVSSDAESVRGAATIRRTSSPFESFGYDIIIPRLEAQQKIIYEDIFSANNSAPARIDFYGEVGKPIYLDDVSLHKFASADLFNPYEYSDHLINNTPSTKTFSCNQTNLPICNAVGNDGRRIIWPITVSAYSSKIILANDPYWRLSGTDITPPTVPTHVRTSNITDMSAQIIWTASEDIAGVAGYQIFLNNQFIDTTQSTTYSLRNLNANTDYEIAISAFDTENNISGRSPSIRLSTLRSSGSGGSGSGGSGTGGSSSLRLGCSNALALNYDRRAKKDDGSCRYSPVLPTPQNQPIPKPVLNLPQSQYLFTVVLGLGSRGSDVSALQQILTRFGYYKDEITGYYGVITEAAVKRYQTANQLEAVGSVGPKTRALLNSVPNQVSTTSPLSAVVGPIDYSASAKDIRLQIIAQLLIKIANLQKLLKKLSEPN